MTGFPKGFLWGAATSAHQVEGNNTNSDWWEWEQKGGGKEPSASACRSYELYKKDFDLARSLNHNCHRLSLEWSRIQPEEGKFSEKELAHYRDVIRSLRERGMEPVVTLHHFTNPIWFAKKGGWLNIKAGDYFLSYVQKAVESLAGEVRFWVTINEPMIYLYYSYVVGDWPPQEKSLFKARKVIYHLLDAHVRAYRVIHDIYQKQNLSRPMVSIAKNVQAFATCRKDFLNRFAVNLRDSLFNHWFVRKLVKKHSLDYIGLNYYSRSLVEVRGIFPRNLLMDTCKKNHDPLPKNSLGWDIYPDGLYEILRSFAKYGLPQFILENGICTDDDAARWEYIRAHLKSVSRAMNEGAKVLGYIYWSLLDNFEWDKGFSPRFGLINVDFLTQERTVRESAKKFAEVCKTGVLA